ncbi:translation initiation factor IF-2-like [Zalophus californianus]|uniref:Translation initiation factor IF-2-like n=1 Tax=Zalophus californianus TaxID=9704 RepID=A0A6P9F146_ZALCA|nr:translation initiation factor IF-2-like [Zalophus californianus]
MAGGTGGRRGAQSGGAAGGAGRRAEEAAGRGAPEEEEERGGGRPRQAWPAGAGGLGARGRRPSRPGPGAAGGAARRAALALRVGLRSARGPEAAAAAAAPAAAAAGRERGSGGGGGAAAARPGAAQPHSAPCSAGGPAGRRRPRPRPRPRPPATPSPLPELPRRPAAWCARHRVFPPPRTAAFETCGSWALSGLSWRPLPQALHPLVIQSLPAPYRPRSDPPVDQPVPIKPLPN